MYWILLIKINGTWSIEFGDFDKSLVEAEFASYRPSIPRRDLKIVSLDDESQRKIDEIVAIYNRYT